MKSSLKYHYLNCYFILTITGIFTVASTNYFVDPAQIFSVGNYEQGVADILLSGNNVANVSNYDERLMQKAYVNNLKRRNDVIVLGSSRSMELRSHLFPGMSFFNHGVSGASLEDYLAIYELYEQREFKPSIVVLGLDPWILNQYHGQNRWKSLRREYLSIVNRLNINADLIKSDDESIKLMELITWPYFKESIRKLLWNRNQGKYYATLDKLNDCGEILKDGSRVYDLKFRTKSAANIKALAISCVSGDSIYSLKNFMCLDKNAMKSLEKFVGYLQDENIRVIFYLPPYHPYVYKFMLESKKHKNIFETENYFKKLADNKGITILGSYNPENACCGVDDFFDGMHPKESCINSIFTYE